MEARRRNERIKIHENIRIIKSYISTDTDTIKRFCQRADNSVYAYNQIEKLKNKNKERELTLKNLEERLDDLKMGYLDEELEEQYNKTISVIDSKKNHTINRKKEAKQKINKDFTNKSHNLDRYTSSNSREIAKAYKYYVRTCNSIPDYMIKKLKQMPNNKGYIWKDIYCYGELPEEKNKPVTLFEKKHDNLLVIHEWTNSEYIIWHKKGKDRKQLYSKTKIKKKY